ncbi:hypothetical protein N9M16_05490 [Candidatus Dependentiae bacterium]|jgi:hypothetical protein|nr:hypothetical protein [Candidatus Dependentiae bacterium]
MGVTVPFVYAQFRRARSGVETTGRGHIHDDDDDEDANAAGRYSNRPRNSAPATTTARRARSVFRKSCFARERLDLDEDESDDESSHAGECIISPGGEDGVRTESSSSSPREAAGRVAEQMGIDKSEVPDGSTAEGAEGADTAVRASRFDPRVRSMPPLVETRHTTQRHRRRTLTRASRLQSNNESSSQTQQLDTHTQILKYPNTNQIPPKHTWRAYVFRTLDDPGSGTLARWVNVTVTSTVLASIVCHVMESRREYADDGEFIFIYFRMYN